MKNLKKSLLLITALSGISAMYASTINTDGSISGPGIMKQQKSRNSILQKNKRIIGVEHGEFGLYDPSNHKAILLETDGTVTYYTGIVEYSQPVTPPNIADSSLVLFSKMPNPKYVNTRSEIKTPVRTKTGGQLPFIYLYGKIKPSTGVA